MEKDCFPEKNVRKHEEKMEAITVGTNCNTIAIEVHTAIEG